MREFHVLGLCRRRPKETYLTERPITASGPSVWKLAEPWACSSTRRLSSARDRGSCKHLGQSGGCLETQLLRSTCLQPHLQKLDLTRDSAGFLQPVSCLPLQLFLAMVANKSEAMLIIWLRVRLNSVSEEKVKYSILYLNKTSEALCNKLQFLQFC